MCMIYMIEQVTASGTNRKGQKTKARVGRASRVLGVRVAVSDVNGGMFV
jgi:hypothetical protein